MMVGCVYEVHIVSSSLWKFRKNIHTQILIPTWNMYRNLTNFSKVCSTSGHLMIKKHYHIRFLSVDMR